MPLAHLRAFTVDEEVGNLEKAVAAIRTENWARSGKFREDGASRVCCLEFRLIRSACLTR